MTAESVNGATGRASLAGLFAEALPEVYGYLRARCGDPWLAEDLTSEAFMAAVSAIERGLITEVTVGWLTVVARRRLIDHWRRSSRDDRRAYELAGVINQPEMAWDEPLDVVRCRC